MWPQSKVHVAERTLGRAQEVPDLERGATGVAQVDDIVDGRIRTWGLVHEGASAGNSSRALGALAGVEDLPHPPDAVDHGVVQVEGRITRGGEEVAAGVTADRVVAAAVNANVARTGLALHLQLEVVDVLGLDDVQEDGGGVSILLVDLGGQIALQAAGAVRKGSFRVHYDAVRGVEIGGAEVDRHVLEGSRRDASTAGAGREEEGREVALPNHDVTLVGDEGAIAGQGCVAAVEDR